MSVLVTGASGFLGTWLCRALLERGERVVALWWEEAPEDPRLIRVEGALEDLALLRRTLAEHEVRTVHHLGAQTLVGAAWREPVRTFTSNIQGTWNVLEACRLHGVERLVVASSDKAYGEHEVCREDTPLRGRFPYDVSKACSDMLARAYHASYGLPVVIARCANLFGGGDRHESRLVPGTIRSVLAGEPPIIRSNGSYVRDYLYVEDAVEAYLRLGERPGVEGEAFNLSLEQPLSVLEMVRRILEAADRADLEPRILDLPEARYEIPVQRLCSEKARRVLGWKPRVGLDEGLARTLAWYQNSWDGGAELGRATAT